MIHLHSKHWQTIFFFSSYFKVIRFDPLAPVQTLRKCVLWGWKCSFLSVTSWIWTVAAKRLFSHFLKCDMICFVLTKPPWFFCYRHICYFDWRCQIAKPNRWTCIFLLGVAINKYTKFRFIRIQNKTYRGWKIWLNVEKIVHALEQKCRSKMFWCHLNWSLRLKKLRNKGQIAFKTVG